MPKFSCNISMLYGEVGFLDRFARAAAAGFRGVEFHQPYEHPPERLAALLAENALECVLFNLAMGGPGEAGIACLPDRRGEFREGVGRAIDYARAMGCRQMNCLAGIAPAGAAHGALRDVFVDNLAFAAAALDRAGLQLVVEPLNNRDVPGFLLSRSDEMVAAMDAVGAANLRLQFDLYHADMMGEDLEATLARLLPRIGHIQFSDNPGRHEPGTGNIDIMARLAQLDALGYDGWVGAEYRPRGATEASLGWFTPQRKPAAPR
jgi:hydroxypyruvate isomerase